MKQYQSHVVFLIVAIIFLGLTYLPLLADANTLDAFGREDGVFEYLTAVYLLIASFLFAAGFLRFRKSSWFLRLSYLGLALLFFLGGGEEISWGERIFDWDDHNYIRDLNVQGELTIHNLKYFQGEESILPVSPSQLFIAFAFVFAVIIPLVCRFSPMIARFVTPRFPVMPLHLGILVPVTYIFQKSVLRLLTLFPALYQHPSMPIPQGVHEMREHGYAFALLVSTIFYFSRIQASKKAEDSRETQGDLTNPGSKLEQGKYHSKRDDRFTLDNMRNNSFRTWPVVAVVIVFFLLILRALQPASQAVVDDDIQTPTFNLLPTSTPAPTEEVEEVSCERPYSDSSIWNIPLDWSMAKIHPMSDLMMNAFFETDDWIGTNTSQYTPNMYWVSNSTPLVPVQLRKNRFRDAIDDQEIHYGEPAGVVMMPLPFAARPALGTDGQLVVVNVDTGEEWGLNEGHIDSEGRWFASGAYRYHIENSGIPAEGFGQRGAGIGQLAGIVRRCEVDRERIDHAVTIGYDYPCAPNVCQQNGWPASIPPFRKTDGRGESQFDIPEGARIAIRPEITREEIVEACAGIKGCEVWTLNMQEYGGFVVDRTGHPKTYAEGHATANWDPSIWTEDMLRNIPSDWYVVIDWNSPSTKAR